MCLLPASVYPTNASSPMALMGPCPIIGLTYATATNPPPPTPNNTRTHYSSDSMFTFPATLYAWSWEAGQAQGWWQSPLAQRLGQRRAGWSVGSWCPGQYLGRAHAAAAAAGRGADYPGCQSHSPGQCCLWHGRSIHRSANTFKTLMKDHLKL